METVYIEPAPSNSPKKFRATFMNGKKIYFGQRGYGDYPAFSRRSLRDGDIHKSRYIIRHRKRENHGKTGIRTPGFWSRWLLWNKRSIGASARDIERRYKIKVKVASR